jgi:hypothetical protein
MLIRLVCTLAAVFLTGSFCPAQSSARQLDESATLREVQNVVAEFRIHATCRSLHKLSLETVEMVWQREVAVAMQALRGLKPSPSFLAAFTSAVQFSKLVDTDMKLSATMDLCRENAALFDKFESFGHLRLSDAIRTAAKNPS